MEGKISRDVSLIRLVEYRIASLVDIADRDPEVGKLGCQSSTCRPFQSNVSV